LPPSSAGQLCLGIVGFIHSAKSTAQPMKEIQDGLDMRGSTERPRRTELVASGDVVPSRNEARHFLRQTGDGVDATVYCQ